MLTPASLLAVGGVPSGGFLCAAPACTAMMALMMRVMGRGALNEAEFGWRVHSRSATDTKGALSSPERHCAVAALAPQTGRKNRGAVRSGC